MKKIFTVVVLLCATLVASAQEVPSSFPRKYLIEHFTGDECGYCPEGMYSIVGYTQKTSTPCIWVSHHYGYNTDEYTISESAKIASACGVSGAPNMAINRTKVMVQLLHSTLDTCQKQVWQRLLQANVILWQKHLW